MGKTTSKWGCKKCDQTVTVHIPMYEAPTHRCPSPKSSKVTQMELVEGFPLIERPQKKVQ